MCLRQTVVNVTTVCHRVSHHCSDVDYSFFTVSWENWELLWTQNCPPPSSSLITHWITPSLLLLVWYNPMRCVYWTIHVFTTINPQQMHRRITVGGLCFCQLRVYMLPKVFIQVDGYMYIDRLSVYAKINLATDLSKTKG